uniref:Sine oculis-binding protein homolog n=1 Tax=Oncorhynchus tshawytscha TaxID=74940 RepID=A0AAZ3Q4U2_ONCTS
MPEMEKGRPPENKRSRKPAHPVKREINQEMKTFAESTMNELLGWYGYDKVELRDNEATEIRNYPNRERRQQHVSVLKVEDVQNVQIVCVWCQKEGVKRYSLCMGTELKSFCSEKCFAACRRAYFKRNKVCDWCKHIRHTKEYLDFGAGAERLQFCSSKCLNQYKMDVFYREARAALISSSPGPGRPTQDGRTESNGGGQNQKLLTPESWNNGAGVVRGRTRSPKGPMPRTVSPSEASSSSSKAPVSGLRHLERHVLPPLPPPEVANHHSVPLLLLAPHGAPPTPPSNSSDSAALHPAPLHAQGLTSPIANPHRCHPGPLPAPSTGPPLTPPPPPPPNAPIPGAYFPGLHSPPMMGPRGPVPMPSMMNFGRWPSLGPFFPQPMVLVPYPIIVPIPVPIPIPIPIPMPPKASPSDPLGISPSGVIQPVPDGMERRCSSGVKLPSPGSSVLSRLSRTTNQGLPSPSDHPKRDITDWVKSERQAPSPMSTPHSAASSPRACYDASPSSTSVIEALLDFKLGQQQQPERQLIHRVLQRTPVKLELNPHGMVDLSGKRESRAGQSTRVLDTRVDHHNHHHDIIKPTPPPSQSPLPLHDISFPQSPNTQLPSHTPPMTRGGCRSPPCDVATSSPPIPDSSQSQREAPLLGPDSVLSELEAVKENSCSNCQVQGRDQGQFPPLPTSQSEEPSPSGDPKDPHILDEDHAYALPTPTPTPTRTGSFPATTHTTLLLPKLRDKGALWSPPSVAGPGDMEPAQKRRCLRIRDQNK